VRQLFHDALAQASGARDAFVTSAGPHGHATRDEVRSLLAAHQEAGQFLESPVARLPGEPLAPPSTLRAGDHVGRFHVIETLGAGGMGEVYRVRDLQLGREVALKILPPAMAADQRRFSRFERESRVLASLDHPNIAAIHSIEHVDGLHLLVLQLVEGPTLADRVAQGPVPLAEALEISSQLARALEAAHDSGIVHRDLKPTNVKVSIDGHVTLLDFGLAKERRSGPARGDDTVEGVVLGTWGYMSPEQARGLPTDKRTDIWAFGCILYELLTARPAFAGAHPSDSIAAVLDREPDWTALPHALSLRLRLLLRRLLEKDPANRLHDIADARLEIDDARQGDDPTPAGPPNRGWHLLAILAVTAAVAAAALAAGWWARGRVSTVSPITRFAWTLPPGMVLGSAPSVSPDGRQLVFAASAAGTPTQLYVRSLHDLDAQPIPGTEYAQHPFWSFDGKSLGFFARGALMRLALDDGVPVKIATTPGEPKGGTWGSDGTIVFAPAQIENALWRVPSGGGTPTPATVLAVADGDNAHRWPQFLPDGVHIVYFVRSQVHERRGVYLARIDRPTTPGTMLFRSENEAVFERLNAREGLLLNASDGFVDVRRLDLIRMSIGDPRRLVVPSAGNTPHHAAMLSVGAGVLAHTDLPMPYGARLASVQLSGANLQVEPVRGIINWPRLSPDGTRLATVRFDAMTGIADLWVDDLERGTRTRVTHERIAARLPVWSPDGSRLAYVSGFGTPVLTTTTADGTGEMTTIPCPWSHCEPTDWSADGRWLVVQTTTNRQADVWLSRVDGTGEARPLLTASYTERDARMSPDGRLLAYVSEESGRAEVSVRSLDESPRRVVVSPSGGSQPVWVRDGRTLAFVDPDGWLRLVEVHRQADGRLVTDGLTRPPVPAIGLGHFFTQYDLSPDGRLHFVNREPGPSPPEIRFILGWRGLLD
jgi:Tol biopolymer transport system component